MTIPEPGDYACLSVGGDGGKLIQAGEWLCGDKFDQYEHAFIYLGGMTVVQAEPGGAVAARISSYQPAALTLWSTGKIPLTPVQRTAICKAARGYIGTPYSFADYAAIAAHRFHLPVPGLQAYIASTGHLICSQLVDCAYQAAGVQLFSDGRWNGYVTPADLAGRLLG